MEKYYVYFSETALYAPLVMGRKQNTIVVCDGHTGKVYRATGLYLEQNACMLQDKIHLAAIEQDFIIHFETYKGLVSDFDLAMKVGSFNRATAARVIDAKSRFDLDQGWSILPAALGLHQSMSLS